MNIEVRMAIMSHLSDAQVLLRSRPDEANLNINFAKYLLSKYKEDLTQEIPETELDMDWCTCRVKFFDVREMLNKR